jgi:hypothetical protein
MSQNVPYEHKRSITHAPLLPKPTLERGKRSHAGELPGDQKRCCQKEKKLIAEQETTFQPKQYLLIPGITESRHCQIVFAISFPTNGSISVHVDLRRPVGTSLWDSIWDPLKSLAKDHTTFVPEGAGQAQEVCKQFLETASRSM